MSFVHNDVFLDGERLIRYNELKKTTPELVKLMWARVVELMEDGVCYDILANLENVELPNAAVREQLKIEQNRIAHRVNHFAVFTGKNRLINLSVKFVLGKGHFKSVSISTTEKEAREKIERFRNK